MAIFTVHIHTYNTTTIIYYGVVRFKTHLRPTIIDDIQCYLLLSMFTDILTLLK